MKFLRKLSQRCDERLTPLQQLLASENNTKKKKKKSTMPAVEVPPNFCKRKDFKRCIDEIVIFDCFCWNFQSVKGYVVMLGSTG